MGYTVAIKEAATGRIACCSVGGEWDVAATFDWEDGNHCCDCNRQLLFEKALGIELEKPIDCSMDRFTIEYIEAKGHKFALADGMKYERL